MRSYTHATYDCDDKPHAYHVMVQISSASHGLDRYVHEYDCRHIQIHNDPCMPCDVMLMMSCVVLQIVPPVTGLYQFTCATADTASLMLWVDDHILCPNDTYTLRQLPLDAGE